MHRLAEHYQNTGKLELAKSYLEQALSFWERQSNKRSHCFSSIQMGKIEHLLDNSEQSEKIYKKVLQFSQENNLWLCQIDVLIWLGRLEIQQGNFHQAIEYLERSTTLSLERKIPYYFKYSYADLAEAYQAVGQIQKANSNYQEYLEESQKELDSNKETTTEWMKNIDILYEKELALSLIHI